MPINSYRMMFALSRAPTDATPLQTYMAISELDARRAPEHRLTPGTVRLLGRKFEEFGDQYRMFSEFPALDDQSIGLFLKPRKGCTVLPWRSAATRWEFSRPMSECGRSWRARARFRIHS